MDEKGCEKSQCSFCLAFICKCCKRKEKLSRSYQVRVKGENKRGQNLNWTRDDLTGLTLTIVRTVGCQWPRGR